MAATNLPLPALVRQGLFREDLFYWLSAITVEVCRRCGNDRETWPGSPSTS